MNTPSIRFKGFTGDWEQRKLGDCCREFKSGSFIPTSDIEESGEYPVFGGNGLRGYASEYNHDGEFALIGRQGALCGNMNYSTGKAYFTEHAVAVQANETANTKFMYYLLDKMNLGQYSGQSAQPGLAVGKLVKLEELFPSVGEQEKIGTYFAKLDNLITLHQRKRDSLKQVKKYMLQKMFPKQGEKVPEIRFKGFTDDWEQRKFGEIFQEYSEKKHDELPPLMIMQGSGTILRDKSDRDLQYDKSSLSSYKMVKKNDFIVHLRSFEGGLEKANSEGIISPAYHTFHGDNTDTRFYYPFFRSQHFIDVLLKPHVYGIRDGKSIDINGMKTIKIPVPSYEEQQKIGNYIELMDNLITFHQRKSDSLKEIKKFMLQNMFPRE